MPKPIRDAHLERACEEAAQVSGAIAASVWMWDDARHALQMAAHFRLDPEYVAYGNQVALTAIAQERAPVYRAYRERLEVEAEGPMRDPRYAYFTHEFADRGFETITSMPLLVGDEAVGVMALYFERKPPSHALRSPELRLVAERAAGVAMATMYRLQLSARVGELEQVNAVLQQKVRDLDQISRMKTDLLGIISHELSTPLTGILGYTNLLKDRAVALEDPVLLEFLGHLHHNAMRLQSITEDGMTVNLIETGLFRLSPEPCDLVAVVQSTLMTLAPQLSELQLRVKKIGFDARVAATLDQRRIAQVMHNLLHNAVKFSPQGGVIEVNLEADDAEVRARVRDQGPGVPVDLLERIFDKYYQVDSGPRRRHDGVGLGLMIARNLVEAHGGTLTARSARNKGCEFVVRMPRHCRTSGDFPYTSPERASRRPA